MKGREKRLCISVVLLALSLIAGGCAATRSRRAAPKKSGFLGDYSQLTKKEGYGAALVEINPNVRWPSYNAVQIDSVSLWATKATGLLSAKDRQMLTDVLYKALHNQLGQVFTITNSAGPNTIRLRAALTQAKGANVPLRIATTVVPQLRAVGSVVGLAGDTATTIGGATVEIELLDSVTNERLAAAVDERAGTKALFASRAYTTWGDVEAACQYWASRVGWQLARQGVQRKPGVAMPKEPAESRSL